MLQTLAPQNLNAHISPADLAFSDTSELLINNQTHGWPEQAHVWIAQADAKKSATFGLGLHQPGFNLLVLGEQGTGRAWLLPHA